SFYPLAEVCADDPATDFAAFRKHCETVLKSRGRLTSTAYSRIGPPLRVVLEPAEAAMRLRVPRTVEATARRLAELPWLNPFVGYPCGRDATATPLLAEATDRDSWADPGPGSRKGLRRCGAPENLTGLLAARDATANKVPSWTFDIHDVQHVFC